MVLTADGEVLTNNHVVRGAWKIEAQVPGGASYTATVVGVDPTHDVALLQLTDASGLSTISPGDASTISVGDQVTGVGNALGRGGTPAVATGSVTGTERTITAHDPSGTDEKLSGLIQTNANIQPGDSGGALIDSEGNVVGMITAGNSQSVAAGGQTTGFAIPIEDALSVVDQIHNGDASSTVLLGERGYLGVAVGSLDRASAAQLGVTSGALVVGLDTGGPAEQAGMTTPAVISSVDGQAVTSAESLGPLLHSHVPGDSVSVTWVDAQGSHTADVQLTTGPGV
jgi:S1-C subfamily serine protease